ncbi:plasmid mobilization protein [Salinibacter altiplanensis]|uniref:plasmid mobilization protein n=1 Tax=Salinibacter altiplanensis TaxID=1803181 RepID=UPI000C9F68A8|nr:plasmid mobilization relaxosome protein MobC [Salinibacter altiplanensis]
MSQQSQNKGGRPKKPEEERRSLTHGLRLSPNEKEELEARADRAGLSLSEYLRRKALGKPVKTKVDGKALKELNRIGVNLNQLARAANRGDILIGGQVREAIEELRSLIEEIDSQPADSQPADSQSAESQSDSKGSESNG